MEITGSTSPELAIKIAYDYARHLRSQGADPGVFSQLQRECVEQPYGDSPLLIYIRAGFKAGFDSDRLPWRRQIEAEMAN